MENSVNAAIEKIKLHEQITEAKLKEKRESDVTVANLNRAIRDTKTKADTIKQETIQIQLAVENLQYQIDAQKYRRNAILYQLDKLYNELNKLQTESERKIASVWEIRADITEAMKRVAESCDVRTLLIKSSGIDTARNINSRNQKTSENILINKRKLQNALDTREKAINKRRNLLDQPEKDDEFIRIKEALRYSEQMVANIKNQDRK